MSRILLLLTLFMTAGTTFSFGQSDFYLGRATRFMALANKQIVVKGPGQTWIRGDIGTSPGKTIIGEEYLEVTGKKEKGTELAAEAMAAATKLYLETWEMTEDGWLNPNLGNGHEVYPGIYKIDGDANITGITLLETQGASSPFFIFKIDGNLKVNPGALSLSGVGVEPKNIFWLVEGDVDVLAPSSLYGNIIAKGDIRFGKGASLYGRAISLGGTIYFDNNPTVLQNVTNADLYVEKVVDNQNVSLGSHVTYTITAINKGPGTARNVAVKERIPSGLKFIAAKSATKGVYDEASNEWRIGDMVVNEKQVLKLVFEVIGTGDILNEVIIIGDNPDPNPTDDEDDEILILPDLSLTKRILNQKASYNKGDVIAYEIRVENKSSKEETNINVREQLASGLKYVRHEATTGTSYDVATGIFNIPTLAGKASATLVVYAEITGTGNIRNVATIIDRTPDNDKDPDNNEEEVEIILPDLGLTKKIINPKDSYKVNDVIAYEIKITNNASTPQTNVNVREALAQGLEYVRHTATAGTSYNVATGIFTIPTLAGNASATLVVYAKIVGTGVIRNVATITDRTPDNDKDPDNNEEEVEITLPDLGVTKELVNAKAEYMVGDMVQYRIVVTNNGAKTEKNVKVGEKLPEGLRLVDFNVSTGASYDPATGVFNITSLAANATAVLTINAQLVKSGKVRNIVSIISKDPSDPNDPNNPGDPGNPGNPGNPGDPNNPGNPGNPGDPNNPGGPGDYEDSNPGNDKDVVEIPDVKCNPNIELAFEVAPASVCREGEITLKVTSDVIGGTYTWILPQGWKQVSKSADGSSITVKAGTAIGNQVVKVTVNTQCKDVKASAETTVSVTGAPAGVKIEGGSEVCFNSVAGIALRADAVDGLTYKWTLSGDLVFANGSNDASTSVSVHPKNQSLAGGKVFLTVTNACGFSTTTEKMLIVTPTPQVPKLITGSLDLCEGQETTFSTTALATATKYTWTFPADWAVVTSQENGRVITVKVGKTGGEVSVKAANECNESTAFSQTAKVTNKPAAPAISAASTTACIGATLNFSVEQVPGMTYTWTVPQGWSANRTTGTSIVVTVGEASGDIEVYATSTVKNCGAGAVAKVAVAPTLKPATPGAINSNMNVCLNSTGNAFSVAAVAGADSYEWEVPAGWRIEGADNGSSISVTSTETGGVVRVRARNGCGISDWSSLNIDITMPPAPVTRITDNSNVCDGLVYTADPVAGATSYNWTVTEGFTIESGQGTATIKVKASNPNAIGRVSVTAFAGACAGSAEYSIEMDAKVADGQLDFPKAFSPNGDGKNDTWLVKNLEKFPDNEMVIFNRWGSEVYKQKNYKNDWAAKGLEQGTYFYKVRVKLCDGVYKDYSGYVTIFR